MDHPKPSSPEVDFAPIGRPARMDPARDSMTGQWLPGHSGNPGHHGPRRQRKFFRSAVRRMFNAPGGITDFMRQYASEALGIPVEQIPVEIETPAELAIWVMGVRACGGNIDAFREFADRLDPKPRRVELSGPDGSPVRAALSAVRSTEEQEAAQRYYDRLNSGDDED